MIKYLFSWIARFIEANIEEMGKQQLRMAGYESRTGDKSD